MSNKYLVETVSIFRMRYVVEADHPDHAADSVTMEEATEFSQHHVAENITSVREITDNEVVSLFFEDNQYMCGLPKTKAFEYVTKVEY